MNESTLFSIFNGFQKIPKGVLVDEPDRLIKTGISIKDSGVFFTRRSLKHLAEKGVEGKRLLKLVPDILKNPDVILKGKDNRSLFVRFFPDAEGEPHVVVVELSNLVIIVVTSFVADKKYLKNFEILWRTGTPLA